MVNNISFKATFVDKVNIKTLNESGEYVDKQVSFVKRNPYSQLDYDSIVKIGNQWGGKNYVHSMLHHSDIIKDDEKREVFLITEQTDNFRKIVPEKVLGMIEITKHKGYNKINYLQTQPNSAFENKSRKNKGVGYAMLVMAEKLANGKDIILHAKRTALEFYKKFGFVVTYDKCPNPKMLLRGKCIKVG